MQDVQNQPEEQKQVAEEENQQPPEDVEMTFGSRATQIAFC